MFTKLVDPKTGFRKGNPNDNGNEHVKTRLRKPNSKDNIINDMGKRVLMTLVDKIVGRV